MRWRTNVFAVDDEGVQIDDDGRILTVARDDPRLARRRVPDVPPPPGRLIAKIATINDLHVGEPGFGLLPRIHPPRTSGRDHYTVRAANAAIDEAVAWGAELLVVKGDITWSARPGQWELAAELLAAAPVPVVALMGNHDVSRRGQHGRPWLEQAGIGTIVDSEVPVESLDVGPLHLVFADSNSDFHRPGIVPDSTREAILRSLETAAVGSGAGTVVMLHHYPNRFPMSTRYPPGIHHAHGVALFDAMAAVDRPPTLVTCGHTHRNRRYRRSGIEVTEVGSTKDYAGVWAGYAIHEGGIRQTVRRIAEPGAVEWLERTKRSCLGLWGEWTPGRLRWRCFSLPWRGTPPDRSGG